MKFTETLRGKAQQTPPIWLMRQAGRYLPEYRAIRKDVSNFLELCFTPELAAEVTLQPICRFDMDAAILFSDILVIPYALDQKVAFVPGKGPQLEQFEALSSLSSKPERLEPVYETIQRVRQELGQDKALIGFAGSPWTVITYMLEGSSPAPFARTLSWLYRQPEQFVALLDIVTQATIDYLEHQVKAGVNALQLFDSWAGAVPDGYFEHCIIQPTRKIVTTLQSKYPDTPIIGFPRGAGEKVPDYIKKTGVQGIGIDQQTSATWAANELCQYATVQGNLDPMLLLNGGQKLTARVLELKELFRDKPYIFNLGHGVIKETPPEHVAQVVETLRST